MRFAERGFKPVIASMGTLGIVGRSAADNAIAAIEEVGGDLSGHRSQGLNAFMLKASDVVFGMSPGHITAIQRAGIKGARLLSDFLPDVPEIWDPVGGPIDRFRASRDLIAKALDGWLDSLGLAEPPPQPEGIDRVDHIGIAVHSIEEATPFYRDVLGLELVHEETVEAQGVRVAFFKAGQTYLELLEPTGSDTTVGKFLEKRGPGIHHVALGVPDILAARAKASEAGARLLSETPLDGAHGKLISFLHPKDAHGVLYELCQRKDTSREG